MANENGAANPRQGALNPSGADGVVVVQNPPNAALHMSPDEADISGVRLLDAADRARKGPGDVDDEEEAKTCAD